MHNDPNRLPAPPPYHPQFVPCPRCRNPYAQRVGYTLWGGWLGPRLLHHVRCTSCGYTYNGKTGLPNDNAILVYIVAGFGMSVLIMLCLIMLAAL